MLFKKAYFIEALLATIAVILMIIAWAVSRSGETTTSIILWGSAFAIGGFFKAKEGIEATIENKALNVEILMILAALGAFVIRYYSEGAILIIIFSISGVLESYTSSKSEKALTNLLKLAPKTAVLVKGDEEIDVLIDDLKIGDMVVVKVGEQVPVDGVIKKGETSLDQQAITGEFVPVYKRKGGEVFAGSINLDGIIYVETTKDPKDSVVQKIVQFVKDAQADETKTETTINKIEKYYVYIVIALAILFMVLPVPIDFLDLQTRQDAIYRGIIVLVVGSPCALVASISPAMLSSLSNAARKRILIKGGSYLENMKDLKAVVFDKTGTITTGIPKVMDIVLSDDVDADDTLRLIYTLESHSTHPLAQAVTSHLKDQKALKDLTTNEVPGRGMEASFNDNNWQIGRFDYQIDGLKLDPKAIMAKGLSMVPIIKEGYLVGYISLKDTIRSDVKQAIIELKKRGMTPIMLTGDHQSAAHQIATEVGIDEYYSQCFPEDKVHLIKEIKKTYGKVMMIGDGINDAPALQIADIGCAMGTGTDVSIETADIIFMNDDLCNLPKLIDLAKRTRTVTTQNIVFSVSVIVLLLITNVFGRIELPLGVVFHEGSTILVILNSLRLLFK
ncbi:MAG: heavy metal translocating P-type ATPase [Acholeplasmataceae bacterium]